MGKPSRVGAMKSCRPMDSHDGSSRDDNDLRLHLRRLGQTRRSRRRCCMLLHGGRDSLSQLGTVPLEALRERQDTVI
jgi:hypothetical protein